MRSGVANHSPDGGFGFAGKEEKKGANRAFIGITSDRVRSPVMSRVLTLPLRVCRVCAVQSTALSSVTSRSVLRCQLGVRSSRRRSLRCVPLLGLCAGPPEQHV